MKIISKLKDYYDHIQHTTYLGGDNQICYTRNKIDKWTVELNKELQKYKFYPNGNFRVGIKWLAIAEKRFLLITEDYNDNYKLINKKQYEKYCKFNSFEYYCGLIDPVITELSKKINQPVFTFNCIDRDKGKSTYEIDEDIPILSNLGLASFIDPLTMYNDIYFFIANVLRQNPDTVPPVELDNQYKILQHGFDKQSFKHRK